MLGALWRDEPSYDEDFDFDTVWNLSLHDLAAVRARWALDWVADHEEEPESAPLERTLEMCQGLLSDLVRLGGSKEWWTAEDPDWLMVEVLRVMAETLLGVLTVRAER